MKNELLLNLEHRMAVRGMTKTELARELGLSPSTVHSWWQRGTENISIRTLRNMAELFHISLDELVYGYEQTSIELTFEEREIIRMIRKYYKRRNDENEE